MNDIKIETIKWSAPEYVHKEHNNDWFWTIGLVTILACIGAVWYGSYVFAIFLFVSGICLIMFTVKMPRIFEFTMDSKGIKVDREMFEWKQIKSFNLKELEDGEYNKLIIETTKHFLPIYGFFVPKNISAQIKTEISKASTESEIEESRTVQFAEKIGF
ncbi:MAG: hypothetical protein EOM85_02670 [Candidatus Moranbacteria bacterium]|nr:hypothetical protein [Candidatus Moranbacteria bacterium]